MPLCTHETSPLNPASFIEVGKKKKKTEKKSPSNQSSHLKLNVVNFILAHSKH